MQLTRMVQRPFGDLGSWLRGNALIEDPRDDLRSYSEIEAKCVA